MLFRYANLKDLDKIEKVTLEEEVIVALNRESNQILGYIVFNTEKVLKIENLSKNEEVAKNLEKVAKRQISREGKSFHFRYRNYLKMKSEDECPVCLNKKMPKGEIDIAILPYSYLGANQKAQGDLFGKCHLTSKVHASELFDLNDQELLYFMKELQTVAAVLKEVTGAVKINYEFHGNTIPHLHCHLFPRYLDDKFPSLPIDYNSISKDTYKDESFEWFVSLMRRKLISEDENIIIDF